MESARWIRGSLEVLLQLHPSRPSLGREGIAESIRAFHDDGLPSNKLSSNGHAF
jgi:hypothetical protein